MDIDLVVSIVSGSNEKMTIECLESLFASFTGKYSIQVWLVDNASPFFVGDTAKQRWPEIIMLRNPSRLGFGANHNQVMQQVDARFVLLLNDDTLIDAGVCEALLEDAEKEPNVGFFGPHLTNPDGSLQHSVFRFPSPLRCLAEAFMLHRLLPFGIFDDYSKWNHASARVVEFLSGAAIMVRSETIKEIGLLDEGFFMYSEETDWCLRGLRAGWKSKFVPGCSIMHYGGGSSVSYRPERSVEFLRSQQRFILKHYGYLGLALFGFASIIRHFSRWLLSGLRGLPSERKHVETDALLWYLGLLKRPGLSELSKVKTD